MFVLVSLVDLRVDERSADSSIGRDDFFRRVFSFLRLDL